MPSGRDSPAPSVLLREKKMPMPTKAECEGYYADVIDALPVLDSHVCVGRPDKLDVSSCHVSPQNIYTCTWPLNMIG